MAGTIIADFIRTDASQLSLNVGNTTFATINASGFFSNTGTQLIAANGKVSGASVISGSITSAAFATAANTIPRSSMTTGSVLQVVQANSITYASTTSATYQQSSLTVTITPTSATSKVLVQVQTQIGMAQSNWSDIALFRNNTTNLSGSQAAAGIYAGPSSGTFDGHGVGVITFLDSPETTSATIYTMFWKSRNGSGAARIILDSMLSTITATEIAG